MFVAYYLFRNKNPDKDQNISVENSLKRYAQIKKRNVDEKRIITLLLFLNTSLIEKKNQRNKLSLFFSVTHVNPVPYTSFACIQ